MRDSKTFTFVSESDILWSWCYDKDMTVLTHSCLRSQEDRDIVMVHNVERLSLIIGQLRHVSSQCQRSGGLLRPYSNYPMNSFSMIRNIYSFIMSDRDNFLSYHKIWARPTGRKMPEHAPTFSWTWSIVNCLINSVRSHIVRVPVRKANVKRNTWSTTCWCFPALLLWFFQHIGNMH